MKHCAWTVVLFLLAATSVWAQSGRSFDLAGGAGTGFGGNFHGGFWPAVSATGWFGRWLGANGEFSFASADNPPLIRPWALDGNLAFRPLTGPVQPALLFGVGVLQYGVVSQGLPRASGPGYMSITNAAYHLGLALKRYFHGRWFVRLGYSVYWAHQIPGHPQRFAVMLGYSWGEL